MSLPESPEPMSPWPPPNGYAAADAHSASSQPATELATIGQRFKARLLDGLIMGIPFAIFAYSNATTTSTGVQQIPAWTTWVLAAAAAVYEVSFIALRGQTPGKMLMKIRVIRLVDGSDPGWAFATIRHLLILVCGMIPIPILAACASIAVYVTAIRDPRRQGLHDKAAGTIVVKVPKATLPA